MNILVCHRNAIILGTVTADPPRNVGSTKLLVSVVTLDLDEQLRVYLPSESRVNSF